MQRFVLVTSHMSHGPHQCYLYQHVWKLYFNQIFLHPPGFRWSDKPFTRRLDPNGVQCGLRSIRKSFQAYMGLLSWLGHLAGNRLPWIDTRDSICMGVFFCVTRGFSFFLFYKFLFSLKRKILPFFVKIKCSLSRDQYFLFLWEICVSPNNKIVSFT